MIYFKKLYLVLLFFLVSISCIAQTKESNSKYSKGISYVDKNNYAKAIEEFKECLKIDTVATLSFNLGINSHDWIAYCYFKLGEIDSAKYYSDFYKYRPYNRFEIEGVDSIYGRGIECSRKKNYKEALECLNEVEQKIASIYGSKNMHLNKIWIEQAKLQYMLNHHPNAINILTKVWYNYNDSLGPCKNWKKVGDLLLRCYYDEGKRENYLQSERLDSNTVIIKRTDAYKTGLFQIGENSDITLILPMEYSDIRKINDRFLFVNENYNKHFIVDFSNGRFSKNIAEGGNPIFVSEVNGIPVFYIDAVSYSYFFDFNGKKNECSQPLSYIRVDNDSLYFEIDSIRFKIDKKDVMYPIPTINNIFPEIKTTSEEIRNNNVLNIFNREFIVVYQDNKKHIGLFRKRGNSIECTLPCNYSAIRHLHGNLFLMKKNVNHFVFDADNNVIVPLSGIVDDFDFFDNNTDIELFNNNGKLFQCGNSKKILFDTKGNVFHLPIGWSIICDKDQELYCYNSMHNLKIPLSKFPLGKMTEFRLYNKNKEPLLKWHISMRMDYPRESSELANNIRYWMSSLLTYSDYTFFPNETTSPQKMYQFYASQHIKEHFVDNEDNIYLKDKEYTINCNYHYYDYDAYRLWEDDNYVTYIAGESSWWHDAISTLMTFDKRTGKQLNVEDCLDLNLTNQIRNILYGKTIDEIVTKTKENIDSVRLYIGLSPEDCPLGQLALTPNGIIFQYNDYGIGVYAIGAYSFTIPYEVLYDAMIIPPMSLNAENVFTYSLEQANSYCTVPMFNDSTNEDMDIDRIKHEYGKDSGEYWNYIIRLAEKEYEKQDYETAAYHTKLYVDFISNISNYNFDKDKSQLLLMKCFNKLGHFDKAKLLGLELLNTYTNEQFFTKEGAYTDIYLELAKTFWFLNKADSALYYQDKYIQCTGYDFDSFASASLYASASKQHAKCKEYSEGIINYGWGKGFSTNNLNAEIIDLFKEGYSAERKEMREQYMKWFQNVLPKIACETNDSLLAYKAFDAQLISKNILLNIEQSMRNMILSSQDTTVIRPFLELLNCKQRLAEVACDKMIEKDFKEVEMMKIRQKMGFLEADIKDKSKVYGNYLKQLQISIEDIRRNLHKGEIAIEFANSSDSMYYALVLSSNKATPIIIQLCSSAELKGQSANLYKIIWEPIMSNIDSVKSVYFSPAGELYKLPIEYVSNTSGQNLNEIYDIYRLSSTREIVLSRDSTFTSNLESNDYAVLYGYIDYYADKLYTKKNAKRLITQNKKHSIRTNLKRTGLHRSNVERLKYTEQEIADIDSLLRINNYAKVDAIYKNEAGTESSIKSYSGSRIKILHLATHGFYITKSEMDNFKTVDFLSLDNMNIDDIEDKELVRSGLLFAGANHTLESDGVIPEDADDGILTSLEVASLDLFGLDLVVLSACQTAQGDLTDDGVMGLQRGFKKAGAHSILMSLWKVNDEATQILMTQFYKNLTVGKSKRESLISAQKYLRMYNNGIYSAPEYWAAFILLDGIN